LVILEIDDWLKPSDIKNDDVVLIIDEGRIRTADETPFNRDVFEITVALPSGQTKIWTMNKTTQKSCIEAWGKDTSKWVNKEIRLKIVEQNVRGVLKKVIYGIPIVEKT